MGLEDDRISDLAGDVRALTERLGETNVELKGVSTELRMYMAEREKADTRARRYAEIHDQACRDCRKGLDANIVEAAAAGPFVAWTDRYKILVAIGIVLFLMFGQDLGALVVRLIARGG